ncbi:MAG: PDGLE domain-containing protein [Elusimicrobia bacterium]|nr:PDGLE domain-containing protein [Elusimicrobiota bacterium]
MIFPFVLVILAAIFASQNPDGLDKVSQILGFASKGIEHSSIMTGYTIPFLGTSKLSTVFAGIAGVLLMYGFFILLGFLLKKCENLAQTNIRGWFVGKNNERKS